MSIVPPFHQLLVTTEAPDKAEYFSVQLVVDSSKLFSLGADYMCLMLCVIQCLCLYSDASFFALAIVTRLA